MCLILLAIRPNADQRLIVAANRDEQYARPTAHAAFWPQHPDILGGRDLLAGGTWLGVTRSGRFAAVTNFREDPPNPLPPRSRGALTADFLTSNTPCRAYLQQVHRRANEYRGFNLIVSDGGDCYYYSNREGQIRALTDGFYGLSNQLLDCDWPKVIRSKAQLKEMAEERFPTAALFSMLLCRGNGEPFSQSFIVSDTYGTTASTVVRIETAGDIDFEERNFSAMGKPDEVRQFNL
jgi:uncharacterized protein with NRDE domain